MNKVQPLMREYTSTSRDNRVEQVLNADVVVHDL